MPTLVPNTCVNCRLPVGYTTVEALKIPHLCVLCVCNPEVMKDWGHKLNRKETPIFEVFQQLRTAVRDAGLAFDQGDWKR